MGPAESSAMLFIQRSARRVGYVGYIVLGNRETGRALGVTLWETETARELSDAKARQIRPQVEQATAGTMRSVEPYEVLFYDVRPR
jgi:hypothetical protein